MYTIFHKSHILYLLYLIMFMLPLEAVGQPISLTTLQIVFISDRNGSNQVYSMDITGNNVQQLTNDTGNIDSVTCSPNGNAIATTGDHGGIKIWNLSNSSVATLFDATAIYSSPQWSRNGTGLAFTSTKDGGFDIYTSNLDGTNILRLTNSSSIRERLLTWSPNDTQIAFSAADQNSTGIYTINANGTNSNRLTTNASTDAFPDWSVDGTKIVFASEQQGVFRVYVMSSSGTNLTPLTPTNNSNWRPKWSPDGSTIAFSSSRDGNTEIYSMSGNGANVQRLTNNSSSDLNGCWLIPSVTQTGTGLLGQYYDNIDLTNRKLNRVDSIVDFAWGTGSPNWSSPSFLE